MICSFCCVHQVSFYFSRILYLPILKYERRYREARQLGQRYERIQKEMAAEGKMTMMRVFVVPEVGDDIDKILFFHAQYPNI